MASQGAVLWRVLEAGRPLGKLILRSRAEKRSGESDAANTDLEKRGELFWEDPSSRCGHKGDRQVRREQVRLAVLTPLYYPKHRNLLRITAFFRGLRFHGSRTGDHMRGKVEAETAILTQPSLTSPLVEYSLVWLQMESRISRFCWAQAGLPSEGIHRLLQQVHPHILAPGWMAWVRVLHLERAQAGGRPGCQRYPSKRSCQSS